MIHQYPPIADENIFQEFCKDLFNYIFNTESFQHYKTKGARQNGIDIFSTSHKMVIQVKKKKILRYDKDLEKELSNDLYTCIDLAKKLNIKFSKFILITTTKRFGSIQDKAALLSKQNPFEVSFWSWEDIEPYITRFPELIKKYYPTYFNSQNIKATFLTDIPRIEEKEVIGRSDYLEELEMLILKPKKIVMLSGIGGIGKSTIAKYFVNKNSNKYSNIIWIDAEMLEYDNKVKKNALTEAFASNVSLIQNLGIVFSNNLSLDDKFTIILNKLQNIDGNNLLIIDNVSSEILKYINRFPNSSHWTILLTSRESIDEFITLKIDRLNNTNAEILFYKYYNLEVNNNIQSILSYIENHPLTIELLAKTAQKRRISITDLTQVLDIEGLKGTNFAKVRVTHDRTRTAMKPFKYLLNIFSISGLEKEEIDMLRLFSVFPTRPITFSDLVILFQHEKDEDFLFDLLSDLSEKGWLKQDKEKFQIHIIIKQVIFQKLEPNTLNCETLIEGLNKLFYYNYQDSFLNKIGYLDIADNVITCLYRKEQSSLNILINNVATIHDHNGNTLKALEYYEKVNQYSKDSNERDQDNRSLTSINIAVSYLRLGNYEKALSYNLEALALLKKYYSDDHLTLAIIYNNIAENYRYLGNLDKAISFNFKSIEIFESTTEGKDHIELATAYNNLSNTFSSLEDRKKSMLYGLKAIEIREKTLDKEHPNLGQSYNNIAVDFEKLGDLEQSLFYHNKALKVREAIFKNPHRDLAESYNNLAELYRVKNDCENSLRFHSKSLKIRKAIFPENHPEISMAHGNLAGVHLHFNDYENANDNFELAIVMRIKNNNIDPTLALFYFNYAILHILKKNLKEANINIDNSLSIFEVTVGKTHLHYQMALDCKRIIQQKMTLPKTKSNIKFGRNNPCLCNSGKKYKHCCGK